MIMLTIVVYVIPLVIAVVYTDKMIVKLNVMNATHRAHFHFVPSTGEPSEQI